MKLNAVRFAAPDPPSNLTVSVRTGKTAIVYWAPPAQGNYSGFRLRVQSFSDTGNPKTSVIPADAVPYVLRDLIPGATYSLQLFTVLDTKESVAYTSRNFTTSESTKLRAFRVVFCYAFVLQSCGLFRWNLDLARKRERERERERNSEFYVFMGNL